MTRTLKPCYLSIACAVWMILGLSQVEAQTTVSATVSSTAKEPIVSFSRDIRPILSDTCFKCHGPDEGSRQAGLRLDDRASVMDELMAVEPGEPQDSELFLRLTSDDPDFLMPPPDSDRVLTKDQIALIGMWIEQGAEWGEHWSFVRPVPPEIPEVQLADWPRNSIDRFVLHRLEKRGLQPSESASREILIRRVYLDLVGLPPTPAQIDEFLQDDSSNAYEQLVDRLLSSPHYGEQMARYWLDVVRYGDTHGLHLDNYREHWPYRDWIINAFNSNKSFRDFSVEQLAGDLLPDPTDDQLIATGFNRAHVTTNEGGSIKDEILVRNVVDRVSTTGTVFMGLTLGCAVCHDHKFDPIKQKEFYQLFAYFNSLDADPMDGNIKDHAPVLMVASDEQKAQLAEYELKIKEITQTIAQKVANWKYVEPDDPPAVFPDPVEVVWIDDELPESGAKTGAWKFVSSEHPVQSGSRSIVNQAPGQSQYVLQQARQPWPLTGDDELFAYVYLDPDEPPREIMLQWNDGNWEHRAYWGENLVNFGQDDTPSRKPMGPLPQAGTWVRLSVRAADVNLNPGQTINGVALTQFGGKVHWDRVGKVSRPIPFQSGRSLSDWLAQIVRTKGSGLPGDLKKIAAMDRDRWNEKQLKQLQDHFVEHILADSRAVFDPLHKQVKDTTKQRDQLKQSIPTTLIYREKAEPRQAHILNRGLYDQPGEKVERRLPGILPPMPEGLPNNRLGLAEWLLSEEHPLTARVAVNRFWQQIFGRGLVETSEDFGAQGRFPTHPDLLDHLATEFVRHNWDVKWLIKSMVRSATYQQSSRVTPELLMADPNNLWLARGARYRLDAETLRDQALAVSGLLVPTIGGPSVKPPQPDGLWYAVGYSGSNTVRFKKDAGHEKVHRRSVYTFWKRTAPPPQMSAFDAPSREECIVRRERTNTPLQALLLMNDPQYVEAARHLAQSAIDEFSGMTSTEPGTAEARWMFRRCLGRFPSLGEQDILKSTYRDSLVEFARDPDAAKALVSIGESPAPLDKYEPIELAAWTMVANLIMNMDEFVTKN